MRWPACSEAPTTTASALSSSAALARPLKGSPGKVWNSQRSWKTPSSRAVARRISAISWSAISLVASATGAPNAAPAMISGWT